MIVATIVGTSCSMVWRTIPESTGRSQHHLEVGECVAQQLVTLPLHRATASVRSLSRSAGRMALSGSRSTGTLTTSAIRCSNSVNCIRLSGAPIVNSKSTSEP